MSKEEILDRHHNLNLGMLSITEPQIHAAMDEYAKQVAIGFAEWCSLNNFGCWGVDKWRNTLGDVFNSEQLYELYTKSIS